MENANSAACELSLSGLGPPRASPPDICAIGFRLPFQARKALDGKGGDCHGLSAAFAYLASQLGYLSTYCVDGLGSVSHAWVEIDGRRYDPVFAKWQDADNYYDVAERGYYDDYGNWVELTLTDSFLIPLVLPEQRCEGL